MTAAIITTASSVYGRWVRVYERWAPALQLAWAALLLGIAIFLAITALEVKAVTAAEHQRKAKEGETVALACARSKLFGPQLATFFEETQGRLGFEAISTGELKLYRSTIPQHCPALTAAQKKALISGGQ